MKIRAFFFLLLLLLFVCSGCSNVTSSTTGVDVNDSTESSGFSFVVAADPQLFRGKTEDLLKAIEHINKLEPAFVIVCGDLVETPSNPKQIKAYKDSIAGLDEGIALYNLAGNHDLGRPVKLEHVNEYLKHFGKLWYKFKYGNSLFVAISSDILSDSQAPLYSQHMKWLKDTLEAESADSWDNIFVFMHHPLYLTSPEEPDRYAIMPVKARKDLLDLFVKHRVTAVFSGHHHDNHENQYNGIDLITTTSITAPMGKAPAGFRIIHVRDGGYEGEFYGLDK